MCPDQHNGKPLPVNRCRSHAMGRIRAKGFSLPLALFILVVLGLLSTVLYRTIAIGNLSVAQEVLSARAFLAADSGAQAGMLRLFPVNGSAPVCSGSPGINQTLTGTGFNNCSVNLICSSVTVDGSNQYSLTSTAICTAGSLRASRVIEVGASQLVN